MLHRIRLSYGCAPTDLCGTLEADETFIGGLEKNKHKDKKTVGTQGRSLQTKAAVMALLQRGDDDSHSQVNATVVPSTEGKVLKSQIKQHVQPGYLQAAYRTLVGV